MVLSTYLVVLTTDRLLVGSLVHQGIQLSGIGDLDLSDPGLTLGALVDELSLVLEGGVALQHGARDGGQDVRGGLDGLDGTDGLAGCDLHVGAGELHVDDVAQGLGGVFGDSDLGCWGEKVLVQLRYIVDRVGVCNRGLLGEGCEIDGTYPCRCRPGQSTRETRCTSSAAL